MDVSKFTIKLRSTGRTVEVWQAGKGPEVVFLHGAGGLQIWGADLELLCRSYRITAPLHPGFGQSDGDDAIDGVLDSVLHTFDVLNELGISKPHVIGHSMGGMIAAEMAATCPNDIDRLVLVSAVGLWDDKHPILDFFTMRPKEIIPHIFHAKNHPLAKAMAAPPADEEMVDRAVSYIKGLSAAGRLMWPIPDRGLSKRLYRITSPTLIVWGESDGLAPVFYAGEFQRRITGAKMTIIKKASHMVMLEQPEQVASSIRSFLRAGPAKSRIQTLKEIHAARLAGHPLSEQIVELKAAEVKAAEPKKTPEKKTAPSAPAKKKETVKKKVVKKKAAKKKKVKKKAVKKKAAKKKKKKAVKKSKAKKRAVKKKKGVKKRAVKRKAKKKAVKKKAGKKKKAAKKKKKAVKKKAVKKRAVKKSKAKKSKARGKKKAGKKKARRKR